MWTYRDIFVTPAALACMCSGDILITTPTILIHSPGRIVPNCARPRCRRSPDLPVERIPGSGIGTLSPAVGHPFRQLDHHARAWFCWPTAHPAATCPTRALTRPAARWLRL